MSVFEGLKRDLGRDDNGDCQELGPLSLDVPESSDHYDSDNKLVILSQ